MELWSPLPGYRHVYEYSNLGRVKRLKRVIVYKRKSIKRLFVVKEKIISESVFMGYSRVVLGANGTKKRYRKHHLVLMFHGITRPTKKHQCNHKDGNKQNNAIENLEWVTSKENNWHKINVLGKHMRGERHHNAKLSRDSVLEIRELAKSGFPSGVIGDIFSISEKHVRDIRDGKRRASDV